MTKTLQASATLPAPALLPSLTTAFSRRAAIFGAVTGGSALMAGNVFIAARMTAPPVLAPADAKLVALNDAYAALDRSTAPDVGAYGPIEDALVSTPADTMVGIMAKARALQVLAARECADPDIGTSLADDLIRLHAAGQLV